MCLAALVDVALIQEQLRQFAADRDWERLHSPKNLAMALSVEASELLEIFQWLTESESQLVMTGASADHVREEVADVMIYLIRLADVLDIDLQGAVASKSRRTAVSTRQGFGLIGGPRRGIEQVQWQQVSKASCLLAICRTSQCRRGPGSMWCSCPAAPSLTFCQRAKPGDTTARIRRSRWSCCVVAGSKAVRSYTSGRRVASQSKQPSRPESANTGASAWVAPLGTGVVVPYSRSLIGRTCWSRGFPTITPQTLRRHSFESSRSLTALVRSPT